MALEAPAEPPPEVLGRLSTLRCQPNRNRKTDPSDGFAPLLLGVSGYTLR
jgi:hypothetical protein